jgi:hypothetical protein
MPDFSGQLRLPHEHGQGVRVHIDLTDDRIRITSGPVEIGDWPVAEVSVAAKEDGFHLMAEGEEVVVRTDDDPGFAVALGVRNAPPLLRRKISERLREMGGGA